MTVTIKEKIKSRLSQLENDLKSGKHISDHGDDILEVFLLIESISKFWSILSEGDKAFIQAAKYAIEEQKPWE